MNAQTDPRPRRLHVVRTMVLLLGCLLFLALSQSQQPAHSQSLASPETPEKVAVTKPGAPSEICPYEGKTNPPPGQTARLFGDDEILLLYRFADNRYLRSQVIDNVGENLTIAGEPSKVYSDSVKFPKLQEDWWLAAAASDLNGDRHAELFSVFKNKDSQLGAIAAPYTASAVDDDWYNSNDRESGDIKDVDAAAGNLDRKKKADGSPDNDEVAIAYRDDAEDLHFAVLDGNSSGTIANCDTCQSANKFYDSNERGNVHHVGVATGDLNGDGNNDEIVTAFKDSGNDLQVLVTRHPLTQLNFVYDSYRTSDGYSQWDNVASDSSTSWSNKRPIDVTTGDLDGDMHDEIIVGFRVGDSSNGSIQLLVFHYISETQETDPSVRTITMDHTVTKNIPLPSHFGQAANLISLSANDLDGDGYDEIAMGFTELWTGGEHETVNWQHWLYTFDYLRAYSPEWQASPCGQNTNNPNHWSCLNGPLGSWHSGSKSYDIFDNETGPEATVSVSTGDLDQDGKAEVALARYNFDNGNVDVYAFDAEDGLKQRSVLSIDSGTTAVWEFSLAMGDQDGDSVYGTYTGHCYDKGEALVQAVIHAPPHWPEEYKELYGFANDYRTLAGFGKGVESGGGTGETAETTIGGSATLGFKVPKTEIGASFTSEWEHSSFAETKAITTSEYGDEMETLPRVKVAQGEEPDYEEVMTVDQRFWCYEYTSAQAPELETIPVCMPRPDDNSAVNYVNDWWYAEGPEYYEDSWVPVGMNLAEGRTTTQSSTYSGAVASRAVDGETDGDYNHGSVAHTNYEQYAWWQVDLSGAQWMDAVRIWNRTDYCSNRLSNFYVLITDEAEFPTYTNPAQLVGNPLAWSYHFTGTVGTDAVIPVNGYGRLVRVQLGGSNNLQLAEVQVYGMPGTPNQWPISAPITSTNGFTLTWPGGLKQGVDGQLYFKWVTDERWNKSGSGDLYFDLGLGKENENVTGSGSANTFAAGMELRSKMGGGVEGEGFASTAQEQSNVLTWSGKIEFSGVAQGFGSLGPSSMAYKWAPYIWLQKATSSGGVKQKFLVLDYWSHPYVGLETEAATPEETLSSGPLITPTVPVINSPTHLDPNTWYNSNTATFTWAQPPGDPAIVTSYRFYLDRSPDTVPLGLQLGLTNTKTYQGLDDGVWYLHVRAMSDGEQWSDAGHRMIHVDAQPPQVSLAVDPPWPTGDSGWYVTPVSVTVSATDTIGSGVAGVEVSTDGATWQPYTAPLTFTADTPGTVVYARARDAVGNISEPVSTTLKIDRTPPDSHVVGGMGAGAWVAQVITNSVGNPELVLAGSITDTVSGQAGMDIEYDGVDWTGPTEVGSWPLLGQPAIEVNWSYTATHQIGAGYHIFHGRAFDAAGNHEEAYEIAHVLWLPKSSPDLGGSSLAASPMTVRPGEEVVFTLVARNGGFQEAHVAITDTLPAGLTPVTDTLPSDVDYDPATRTMTWPPQLLWPGQSVSHDFQARVNTGLGATNLTNQVTFHAFWPNTDLLPPAARQQFLDREQTVTATATVAVNPNLPANADVTPPTAILVQPYKQVVNGPDVSLDILAGLDTRWMYVREWMPNPTTGAWIVVRSSGWINYSRNYTWTLSAGQGVKYLGVWVADSAHNVSTLDEHSLIFVNRMDASQVLADGQRIQYRGLLQGGEFVSGLLATVSGDPDLYVWKPRNAFWPDRYSNVTVLPGQVEEFGHQFLPEGGRYLLEVQAVGASEYTLSLAGQGSEMAAANRAATVKPLPQHPLVVSDPLSAGQVGPAVPPSPYQFYLPLILMSH